MSISPTTSSQMSVLKEMYAAETEYLAAGGPGKASFSLLAPFFASDVVLYQADALPYGGVWSGHDGMEQFFLAMSQAWDVFDMVEQSVLAETNPLVVLTQVHARSRATGRELAFPVLQTIIIDDERITEIRPFYWDTAEIVKACATP